MEISDYANVLIIFCAEGAVLPAPPCVRACGMIDVPSAPEYAPFTISCPASPFPHRETCKVTPKDPRMACFPPTLKCGQVFTDTRCVMQTCAPNPLYGTKELATVGESRAVRCSNGLLASRSTVMCKHGGWEGPHACLRPRPATVKKFYGLCIAGD